MVCKCWRHWEYDCQDETDVHGVVGIELGVRSAEEGKSDV